MSAPKRLVIFAEGEGGTQATYTLVRKLVQRYQGYENLFVDDEVFRLKGLTTLINHGGETDWVNKVKAATASRDVGALLLVLDGDFSGKTFETSAGETTVLRQDLCRSVGKTCQGGWRWNQFLAGCCVCTCRV